MSKVTVRKDSHYDFLLGRWVEDPPERGASVSLLHRFWAWLTKPSDFDVAMTELQADNARLAELAVEYDKEDADSEAEFHPN